MSPFSRRIMNVVEAAIFMPLRALFGAMAQPLVFEQNKTCLVIAPHPDDETLGCGTALLAAREAGCAVYVLLITDGCHSNTSEKITPQALAAMRHDEMLAACAALGVAPENVTQIGLTDGSGLAHVEQIKARIADAIARIQPDYIFSPSIIDRHVDHRAIAEAVNQLWDAQEIKARLFDYPVWFWTIKTWLIVGPSLAYFLRSRLWRIAQAPYARQKRLALEAHKSQLQNLTGEPNWIPLSESFISQFFGRYEIYFERKR